MLSARHASATLLSFAFLMGNCIADAPVDLRLTELGHDFQAYIGDTVTTADVDRDGSPELISTAVAGSAQLLFVYGNSNGALALRQSLITGHDGSAYSGSNRVFAATASGATDTIYLLSSPNLVAVYGDLPLRKLRNFALDGIGSTDLLWSDSAVGDINGDGKDDLVVGLRYSVRAYDLWSGNLLWVTPVADGRSLALVQMDGDEALEVLAGSGPTSILDGATGTIQDAVDEGFGTQVNELHGPDAGQPYLVAIRPDQSSATVFEHSAPWDVLWTYTESSPAQISTIVTADVDGDGRDEILLGGGSFDTNIHVVDTLTHQDRLFIPTPHAWITRGIEVANFTGSNIPDVAGLFWADSYSGLGTLTVGYGLDTGGQTFRIESDAGAFRAVALGDIDGDGQLEQVAGLDGDEYGTPTRIRIVDANDGRLLWQSSHTGPDADSYTSMSAQSIALGHIDADGTKDIVLGGAYPTGGRVLIIDGTTHEVTQTIGTYGSGSALYSRRAKVVAISDTNQDGVGDVVVATDPVVNGSATAPKLMIFSGVDGALIGETPEFGTPYAKVRGLLLANIDDDPAPEVVVALHDSIYAYDLTGSAFDLKWVRAATPDGIRFVPAGTSGPELMTFNSAGGITYYAAKTGVYLRSVPTPGPLDAATLLDGDPDSLLIAGDGTLQLIDATDGHVKLASAYLGPNVGLGNQLEAVPIGADRWQIAVASDAGYFRYLLEYNAGIFSNGFEIEDMVAK